MAFQNLYLIQIEQLASAWSREQEPPVWLVRRALFQSRLAEAGRCWLQPERLGTRTLVTLSSIASSIVIPGARPRAEYIFREYTVQI